MALFSENEFRLRLANGQEWSLVAVEPLSSWLKQFAAILGLEAEENNGSPRIIFDALPGCSESSAAALHRKQESGWTYHSLGFMGIWTHACANDIMLELSLESSPGVDVLMMRATIDAIYARAICSGALPLHGGLVVRNGVGVVLAGRSGAGKSTCCQRIPQPWYSPCDDEVLLVKDSRGEIRVHPFPTLGDFQQYRTSQSLQIQESLPLKGIFFLDQAKRNEACSTGQGEAAILVNDSAREILHQYVSYMDSSDATSLRRQILDLACGVAEKIPVFRLSISCSGEFWVEIERALSLGE